MLPKSCGVYSKSYAQEHAYLRTRLEWIIFAVFVALPIVAPFVLGGQILGLLIMICISLIAVLGLFITTGLGGQINLGQAAFVGVGAYFAAVLARAGMPLVVVLIGGGVSAAIFGAIFGAPALKVKGFYLAIATIAAQFVFQVGITRLPSGIFGGSAGLSVPSAEIFGFTLATDMQIYFLVLAITGLMLFGAYNFTRSRVGRAMISMRDNDLAAQILGINLYRYKFIAFGVGAFYAGIAGGLWAYYTRYVLVDQFTLWHSLWYVGMLIVGGITLVHGAVLGTIFVRVAEQLITILGPVLASTFDFVGNQAWFALMNTAIGLIIILILIYEPRGLAHRVNILLAAYGLWPFKHGGG